ncbi:MAG TPA: hypothetical protein VFF33_04530 [Ignavibacteriaceae bacterium]|nr:hypothetical protein [Ignavibacteriaceae bacterium]
MKKKTKTERTERDIINGIVLILLEDPKLTNRENKKELLNKVVSEFLLPQSDALGYIKTASKEVAECTAILKKKAMIRALIDREFLLRIAKSTKMYNFALTIMKDRDTLCGLYNKNAKGKSTKEILEIVKHLNSLNTEQLNTLLSNLKIDVKGKKK